jgi:5'-AMP-activated protein kinase catalytic alpha subunit
LVDFIKNYHEANKLYPKTSLQFYKILKMIGKGSFGKVHLGLHILTGKKVAIKCIDKAHIKEEKAQKKIIQEVKILRSLDNINIIRILEVFENKKYVFIVTEFATNGDLLKYMRENGLLKEKMTKKIAVQILRGLEYCHSKNILHRDVKLDNILLDSKMRVKLCDFGVSRFMPSAADELVFERCGTPAYIAPEVISGTGYAGFNADIWSLGVLLYALMTGTIPFKAKNIPDLHKIILHNDFSFPSGIFLSQQFKSLIRIMLIKDPSKRIVLDEIWRHDWLKDYSDMYPKQDKKKAALISDIGVGKLTEFGYSKTAVLDSLQSGLMNHISATYYLLEALK